MAVSLSTNTVKLYSPSTGQFIGECSKRHNSTINEIMFSGDILHSCSSDGTIRAWDTRSFQEVCGLVLFLVMVGLLCCVEMFV